MISRRFSAVVGGFLVLFSASGSAEPAPLLPRKTLFHGAEQGSPVISPDGARLAWIGPTNGAPNLWVRRLGTNDPARLVSRDPRGTIRQPQWQGDGQALLYLQDSDGLGNLHVMQSHLNSGNIRDLTPFAGVRARLLAVSPTVPGEVLVEMNLRDRRLAEVFRVDVRSGAVGLEIENTGEFTAWFADSDLNIRLAEVLLPGGEFALSTRSDPRSLWRPILRWGPDDAVGRVVGFGPGHSNVWLVSNLRAPALRLLEINLASGAASIIAQDPRFDVTSAITHPISNTLDAVQFLRARAEWELRNPDLRPDFDAMRRFRDGDIDLISRDLADHRWTLSYSSDFSPVTYALYDRTNRSVTPLFNESPDLERARLAHSQPLKFAARDGVSLEGYLTLPPGIEPKSLPAVVLVHGGPWTRVAWGFDAEAQWLANRGYVVIQVNYRGSSGYGRDHLNAGDREWGGRILLDLIDAKRWATEKGYADPRRVAILGAGFGGYAAMAALALHPDEFAAGVSLSGPPNLQTMLSAVPTAATGIRTILYRRVGRPEADANLLKAQSPVTHAEKIKSPLLAAVTGRDPQAPVAEMDQFVANLRRAGTTVEYLVFSDEAAVLRDPGNRLRFCAAVETFLGKHLGGRVEAPSESERFESLRH